MTKYIEKLYDTAKIGKNLLFASYMRRINPHKSNNVILAFDGSRNLTARTLIEHNVANSSTIHVVENDPQVYEAHVSNGMCVPHFCPMKEFIEKDVNVLSSVNGLYYDSMRNIEGSRIADELPLEDILTILLKTKSSELVCGFTFPIRGSSLRKYANVMNKNDTLLKKCLNYAGFRIVTKSSEKYRRDVEPQQKKTKSALMYFSLVHIRKDRRISPTKVVFDLAENGELIGYKSHTDAK